MFNPYLSTIFNSDCDTTLFMNEIGKRLTESIQLCRDKGMNQDDIAKIIGVTKSAVSKWKSGQVKSLTGENLFTLERLSGLCARWIATGEGEKYVKNQIIDLKDDEKRMLQYIRESGYSEFDMLMKFIKMINESKPASQLNNGIACDDDNSCTGKCSPSKCEISQESGKNCPKILKITNLI